MTKMFDLIDPRHGRKEKKEAYCNAVRSCDEKSQESTSFLTMSSLHTEARIYTVLSSGNNIGRQEDINPFLHASKVKQR